MSECTDYMAIPDNPRHEIMRVASILKQLLDNHGVRAVSSLNRKHLKDYFLEVIEDIDTIENEI